MKVLQINTVVNSGSTGRIAEDIGATLIANGHESYIAYGRGVQKSKSQLIKIGSKIDIILHGLKTRLFDLHGFGSIKATKQLIKEISKINPDAIGLHNIHGYYLNIEILFKYIAEKNIPVIWTFHDCWPFTGHCAYFDSINCIKWKTHCQKCPKTKSYPSSLGWDNSFDNFLDKKKIFNQVSNLHIVTPSNWLKNLVGQSFLKHPSLCIHNGINLSRFKPSNVTQLKEKCKVNDKKVILGVANIWDKRKGLEDFIQLSSMLDPIFQILLIGLTQKQIESLPKNIIGIQRTESIEELACYYSLATVFVNPTYEDNFPTINIEALACGTPVITYKTGGSPEAIDFETGSIVAKGDKKALKDAIIEWCINKNAVVVQEKCRQRAERYFNKDDRYLEYLSLYEQIASLKK